MLEVDPQPLLEDEDSSSNLWNVTVRDEISGLTDTHQYDAVFLCNG